MSAPVVGGSGVVSGGGGGESQQSLAVSRNAGRWKKKTPQQQQDGSLQPAAHHTQGNSQQPNASHAAGSQQGQRGGGGGGKLSASASAFVPVDDFVPSYRPPTQQPYLQREAQLQQQQQQQSFGSSVQQHQQHQHAAPTLASQAPPEVDEFRYRPPHQQPYQQHQQQQQQQQQPQAQSQSAPRRTSKAQRQQQEKSFEQARAQLAQFVQHTHGLDAQPSEQPPVQQQQQQQQRQQRQPRQQQPQQQQQQQQPRSARGRGGAQAAQRPPRGGGMPSPTHEQGDSSSSASAAPQVPNFSGRGRGGKQQRGETRADLRGGLTSASAPAPAPTSSPPPQQVSSSSSVARPSAKSAAWREGHADNSMLAKTITEQLTTNTYDCSICSEPVGRRGRIWSCGQCHIILHLKCITQWYESNRAQSLGDTSYRCPGCMFVRTEPPGDYMCFCGKVLEPEHSPFLTPHSCGNNCGKLRNCGLHECELPCHPGFCARCTLPGPVTTCACGATQHQLKCGEQTAEKPLCGGVCNKALGCSRHRCEASCHNGACEPCKHTHSLTCFCGQRTEQRTCGQTGNVLIDADADAFSFSCEQPCNKKLECGQHSCTQPCHRGSCAPCVRQPPRAEHEVQACACGKASHTLAAIAAMPAHTKVKWSRSSCTASLPSCGAKCGKQLGCAFHTCTLQCGHSEPCGQVQTSSSSSRAPPPPSVGCVEVVKRQCRCAAGNIVDVACVAIRGDSTKGIPSPSSQELLVKCDVRCRAKLACKKHTCGQICCPRGDAHVCAKVCSKPLECGQHQCDAHCHIGSCPPCAVVHREGLSCACGRTTTRPNVPCGTPLPTCPYPCQRRRECGHACLQTCHANPCAPCVVLGPKTCAGGHTQLKSIPCAAKPSCGVTCKKRLRCGIHECLRTCHAGKCTVPLGSQVGGEARKAWSINPSNAPASASPPAVAEEEEEDDGAIRSCLQKCSLPRSDCGHPCQAACHPGEPCPTNAPCKENVRVYCACKRLSKVVPCSNGVSCGSDDEELDGGARSRSLECTAQCEIETRNARFRSALQLDESRESIPYPSELLQQVLALDLVDFLVRAERLFAEFLQMAVRTKTFASMPSNQRWLLHQLASYHNCESESFDQEPRRAVRVVKGPLTAVQPVKMKLSEAVKLFKAKAASSGGAAQAARTTLAPTTVLHLWDLDQEPRIAPSDLSLALRPYSVDHAGQSNSNFRVCWLDDAHAMVVFSDASLASNIRLALERRNLFRTEPSDQASKKAQEAYRNGYANNSLFRRHGEAAPKKSPQTTAATSSAFDDWSETRARLLPAVQAAAASSSWDDSQPSNSSSSYTSDQMSEAEFERFLARQAAESATAASTSSGGSASASSSTVPASSSSSSLSVSLAPAAEMASVATTNQWSMLEDGEEEVTDEQTDSTKPAVAAQSQDEEDGDWQLLAAQPRRNRKASDATPEPVVKVRDAFDD